MPIGRQSELNPKRWTPLSAQSYLLLFLGDHFAAWFRLSQLSLFYFNIRDLITFPILIWDQVSLFLRLFNRQPLSFTRSGFVAHFFHRNRRDFADRPCHVRPCYLRFGSALRCYLSSGYYISIFAGCRILLPRSSMSFCFVLLAAHRHFSS